MGRLVARRIVLLGSIKFSRYRGARLIILGDSVQLGSVLRHLWSAVYRITLRLKIIVRLQLVLLMSILHASRNHFILTAMLLKVCKHQFRLGKEVQSNKTASINNNVQVSIQSISKSKHARTIKTQHRTELAHVAIRLAELHESRSNCVAGYSIFWKPMTILLKSRIRKFMGLRIQ